MQLENEHLQCAACRYSLQKKYQQGQPHSLVLAPKNFELQQKLASEEGMPISRWTRLQTLKQHQKQKCHRLNAINFVRDTHPEVAVDGIASPIEDFRHLLQNIKQRKLKKSETCGKRKKLRKMMYCIAEAHRRYNIVSLQQLLKHPLCKMEHLESSLQDSLAATTNSSDTVGT